MENKNHDGRSGASTESLFDYEAQERGLVVSKPIYDTTYDRIVDHNGKLFRVQIKMTSFRHGRQFRVGDFRAKDYGDKIDMLAVYIKPDKSWYFIPANEAPTGKHLHVGEHSKYSKYLNNWEVFNAN